MEFKTKLKILLILYDLTQKEFADKIQISEQSLSHYLTGRNFPPGKIVQRMAEYFGIGADYLLNDKYEFKIVYKNQDNQIKKVAESAPAYRTNVDKEIQEKIKELITLLQKLKGQNDGID